MPHLGGVRTQGLWPHIRTRPRFLYNAPTHKFHHPMIIRLEVILLTNKHTNNPTLFATLQRLVIKRMAVDVGV